MLWVDDEVGLIVRVPAGPGAMGLPPGWLGRSRAAPAPGMGYIHGARMWGHGWAGLAGLWGAGDWPCCSIPGTRADGPRAEMGS